MQNDLGVKMILGNNFPLADYVRNEMPEKPDKNLGKKIWLKSMKDAKNLEKNGDYKNAMEAYRYIFVNTVKNKLQTIGKSFAYFCRYDLEVLEFSLFLSAASFERTLFYRVFQNAIFLEARCALYRKFL